MEEEAETQQLELYDCFKLGRALRSGDADQFCSVYDSLIPAIETTGANSQFTVSFCFLAPPWLKNLSRSLHPRFSSVLFEI